MLGYGRVITRFFPKFKRYTRLIKGPIRVLSSYIIELQLNECISRGNGPLLVEVCVLCKVHYFISICYHYYRILNLLKSAIEASLSGVS